MPLVEGCHSLTVVMSLVEGSHTVVMSLVEGSHSPTVVMSLV